MTLEDRMRDTINRRTGNVILRADVTGIGSPSQVSIALRRMQRMGMLIRIGKGIYAKCVNTPATATILPAKNLKALAAEVLDRLDRDGTIVSVPPDAMIKGQRPTGLKLSIGDQTVILSSIHSRHKKPKKIIADAATGDDLKIPEVGLKKYVLDLANRYKITYIRTYSDEWADTVTRLADDTVQTDSTENLVIALKKAHKVSGAEMVQMLANYLREKDRV
jgi:hypothetical protein